jgi:hypothetical protein
MFHQSENGSEGPAGIIADLPVGVAAIAGVFLLLAIASVACALLLLLQLLPLSYGAVLLPNGLEQSGPIVFFVYAALTGLIAGGLWKRRNWARRLAILVAIAGIIFVVPAVSSAVVDGRLGAIVREGLQIIVRVSVVFYFSQEPVKEWFAARDDQPVP